MASVSTYSGASYPGPISVNPGTQQLLGVLTLFVTVGQFKRALNYNHLMQTVSDAIPADVDNIVNIQWNYGVSIKANDSLYTFIQNLLGYNSAQMASLLSYAATLQV